MSKLVDSLMRRVANRYYQQLLIDQDSLAQAQQKLWQGLRRQLKDTEIGRLFSISRLPDYQDYTARVPALDYEFYSPLVERQLQEGSGVLFNEPTTFVGLSSGTTGEPKKIPYNSATEGLFRRFLVSTGATLLHERPEFHAKKMKRFGYGSAPVVYTEHGIPHGYLSGAISNRSGLSRARNIFPSSETLEIANWDEKIDAILDQTMGVPIQIASGFPSYLLTIFRALLAKTGAQTMQEVWPGFDTILYSGVPIAPYLDPLRQVIGRPVATVATYGCTESPLGTGLTYHPETGLQEYAFLPYILMSFSPIDAPDVVLGVSDLEVGGQYLLRIGMPNGLLNYSNKDVIQIESVSPVISYSISGRTHNVLSLSGEKVTEHQALAALMEIQTQTRTHFQHYFLAPESEGTELYYRWTLFADPQQRANSDVLATALDQALAAQNAEYGIIRHDGVTGRPRVTVLDRALLDPYFHNNREKGQFKMRTIFSSAADFETFWQREFKAPAVATDAASA
ncbi:MAG: GH3 auxin-responsive promoter family protein [Pseudomonadota bacterium]|nr:GH3 auxin-responsive promoter family protein [Pseudomonadota bacterium]